VTDGWAAIDVVTGCSSSSGGGGGGGGVVNCFLRWCRYSRYFVDRAVRPLVTPSTAKSIAFVTRAASIFD